MKILNLTKTRAIPAQKEAGVVDLKISFYEDVKNHLSFDTELTEAECRERAYFIAGLCYVLRYKKALIGDVPEMVQHLEKALAEYNIEPVHNGMGIVRNGKTTLTHCN